MAVTREVFIGGVPHRFSLNEEQITVLSSETGVDELIELELFLTLEQQVEVLDGLATEHFTTTKRFAKLLGGPNDPASRFSIESYDFSQYLKGIGLPAPIAFQSAYLTDLTGKVTALERQTVFDQFRASRHALKLTTSNGLSGLTNFLPYFRLAQLAGAETATRASRMVNDDPEKLFPILQATSTYSGGEIQDLSEVQLTVLVALLRGRTPYYSSGIHAGDDPEAQTLLDRYITELIKSKMDWKLVSRLSNPSDEDRVTHGTLMRFIQDHIGPPSWVANEVDVRYATSLLAAVLRARYGDALLADAKQVLFKESKRINTAERNSVFIALLAVADYLKDGGHSDEPLSWMLALEPALDQSKLFLAF